MEGETNGHPHTFSDSKPQLFPYSLPATDDFSSEYVVSSTVSTETGAQGKGGIGEEDTGVGGSPEWPLSMGSTIFAPWCISFFITEPLAGLLVSFRGARANERLAIVESTGVEKDP